MKGQKRRLSLGSRFRTLALSPRSKAPEKGAGQTGVCDVRACVRMAGGVLNVFAVVTYRLCKLAGQSCVGGWVRERERARGGGGEATTKNKTIK